MADQNLREQVAQAAVVLLKTFGDQKNATTINADTYINLDRLMEAYKTELNLLDLEQKFKSIFDSIKRMRSSYLPVDLVTQYLQQAESFTEDVLGLSSGEEAANDIALMESYENAFMRMLGMPPSTEDTIAIQSDLKRITDTGAKETKPFQDIETEVLDKRQLQPIDRDIKVDLDDAIASIVKGAPQGDIDLNAVENELFKFCYLLTPPIQDGRISACVNEPSKIVAEPFASRQQNVNSKKPQPSLLETVIRIRLDRASGVELSPGAGDLDTIEVTSDSFGVLESLFIVRLASAIGGLARRYLELEDKLREHTQKINKIKKSNNPNADTQAPNESINSDEDCENSIAQSEICQLKAQQTIEDSILSLLGDGSGVLDLQAQTQRTSGIKKGHLVDGMLGVVSLPRQRIERRLSEIKKRENDSSDAVVGPMRQEIGQIFGTNIGIGTIDIIVFSLALFTLQEKYLLGLLSEKQYERLKKTSFENLLPDGGVKEACNVSVDALTDKLYEGYKIFAQELTGKKFNWSASESNDSEESE